MLIVCTQDQTIVAAAQDPNKGGAAWAPLAVLTPGSQPPATAQFAGALRHLGAGAQPLCLSAHGNDTEMGDEGQQGWGWSVGDVANMLVANADPRWTGPVLIHACAKTVANFSAGLAVQLGLRQRFAGLWCYGYNRPVPSDSGFPDPSTLGSQTALQGTQVTWKAAVGA